MTRHRKKPIHLVFDGRPAHKKVLVREYAAATEAN